jgi:hypothetical protein
MKVGEWVPVMAPPDLAARFLREVADFVAETHDNVDPRLWDDATGTDIRGFLRQLNDDQSRFLQSLAFDDPPRSTAAHGEAMGKTVDEIAGYIGPINKKAKSLGWSSPIRSHRWFDGRTTERVLVLDGRMAQWVRDHFEGETA